ncbi:PAS domain-containing protein [Pelagibius marinus]|uniref:PAS domain-containing protein n=1 Tax=Pelagibius marinus TaxID=2762760 RepID=UPI001872F066|nr:PAS domain-containing protein [Pelagibius marinus]
MEELLEDIQAAKLDLEKDLARYPDLCLALDYWKSKKGDRIAPARADIDPVDIPRLLPRVMLVDVESTEGSAPDFHYRLSGTGIRNVHGYDATGLRPLDLKPPIYGKLIHAHYRAAAEARTPLAHVIVMITNKKQRSYARLILPLSEDGETINMLMTVDSGTQNMLQEFLETLQAIGERD